MSYREINVDGKDYLWRVGRKNIEIRGKDSKFKTIEDRPQSQKRWGVIVPQQHRGLEIDSFSIEIFTDEELCEKYFEEQKKLLRYDPVLKGYVEMVPLPKKTVAVTPRLIESLIKKHLVRNSG